MKLYLIEGPHAPLHFATSKKAIKRLVKRNEIEDYEVRQLDIPLTKQGIFHAITWGAYAAGDSDVEIDDGKQLHR